MLLFNTYYHIYNHANGDDNLFKEEKNYEFFLRKYHQHIDSIAETITWCLMPNHFHLLVKIRVESEIASTFPKFRTLEKFEAKSKFISKQFANLFSSYSQAYNKVYGRRGSLFLKNFKRKEVVNNQYLKNLILYIHLNPIKHGFSNDINDWIWSSFQHFPISHPNLLNDYFNNIVTYLHLHKERAEKFEEYFLLENDII